MIRLIGTILFLILLWILLSQCAESPERKSKLDVLIGKVDSLQNIILFKNAEIAKLKVNLAACEALKNNTPDEGKIAEYSKFKKSDCVSIWGGRWKGVIMGAYYSKEDNKTVYYRVQVLKLDNSFEQEYYYDTELELSNCH